MISWILHSLLLGLFLNSVSKIFGEGKGNSDALGLGNYKIMFLEQTRLAWKQSGRLSPTVSFLVVEMDDGDNTVKTAIELLKTSFPTIGGDDFRRDVGVSNEVRGRLERVLAGASNLSLVRPPLGYHPGFGDRREVRGGIALKIGTWFVSDPIFVVTGCSTQVV